MYRRHHSISLLQAAHEAPSLARLAGLARESGERLRLCESLVPASLRAALRPGPIEGDEWCLLVDNNSVAAKLRQLLPALGAHLRSKGHSVQSIRIKVIRQR